MFQILQDFLIEEYAAGRRVILIFDEAQNLSTEGLEELRMLTNINSNKDELMQLMLVGQPELRDMVLRPRNATIRPAGGGELSSAHHGQRRGEGLHRTPAGRGRRQRRGIRRRRRLHIVHQATGGIPRLVNQLADVSMVYAWT